MNPISIYYCTAFDVPAPYSYEISFDFEKKDNGFFVNFQMEYSHREDLTEDEIVNEGFTLNDNFSWKGILNSVWESEIDLILAKTEFKNVAKEHEIIIKNDDGDFVPKNFKEWSLLIQDLIQAVFETSGKESPWQLELAIIKKSEIQKQKIIVSFANRNVDFSFNSKINLDWSEVKKMMELIYLGDYLEEAAQMQLSNKDGFYLCFDDKTWYKLGRSVLNPQGNKNYLTKLESELLSLV